MFRKWDNITFVSLICLFSSLYFYLPVLTIYYQLRGLNFLQIGSLWGVITLSTFIFEIPTGLIADKYGRKLSIIFAMLFQLIGEILFLFVENYWHFVGISMLVGIGYAFQSGCIQALVYDFLKDKNREYEMKQTWGNINAFGQAGFILGALVSSFIVTSKAQPQIYLGIILTIISVSVALFLSFFLTEPKRTYRHQEKSPFKILGESFDIIKTNSSLRRIILFGLFTTPFLAFLNIYQPPYYALIQAPLSWLGVSRAIAGILAIFFLRYAYILERRFHENGILIATLIPSLFYILMAFVFDPFIGTIFFILNYSSQRLQEPLLADYYNIHIKSDVRATVLSSISMLSSLYVAIMGVITGKIADISIPLTFIFIGVIIFLGSISFRLNKSHI